MPGCRPRAQRRTRGSSPRRPRKARWAGRSGRRTRGQSACELAGLAVHGVLAVPRAVLLQLEAVGVVAAVLARDVVALLALDARQRDLRSDIGLLGHGWRSSPCADRWRLAPHRLHARTRAGWIVMQG